MDLIEKASEWNKKIGILDHDTLLVNARDLIAEFVAAISGQTEQAPEQTPEEPTQTTETE